MINHICNVAAYKFIALDESLLSMLVSEFKAKANSCELKGTILLGKEGINLFLAGKKDRIDLFQQFLASYSYFDDLSYKYSYSEFVPFKKLHVKIRKEIVTFCQEGIAPEKFTAPYIQPQMLKEWLDQNKDLVLLDTRNLFEFEVGAFKKAIHLEIDNFREFPNAVENLQIDKKKPIVTYCTGGIRCEKAAAHLLNQGYEQVYQLQGGILNYFEQCGDSHYRGHCFVFDDRMVLNSKLQPLEREDLT